MEELIHYHGTPITPRSVLHELHGKHFCVSYADPRDVETCHRIGQSVMLDNGAYSFWKTGKATDWTAYMRWADEWLTYPTTWAVIPDVIDGGEADNDRLLCQWFQAMGTFRQSAPVWHLHESMDRLKRLVRSFDRVCFGSSGAYAKVNSSAWNNRINAAFNAICTGGRVPCWIHMLRGMSLSGSIYPFASVDSTDVARNHEQRHGAARRMADRWDALQCPAKWKATPTQQPLKEIVTSC